MASPRLGVSKSQTTLTADITDIIAKTQRLKSAARPYGKPNIEGKDNNMISLANLGKKHKRVEIDEKNLASHEARKFTRSNALLTTNSMVQKNDYLALMQSQN
jgi:hypothetical protein